MEYKDIQARELKEWMDESKDFLLIDVREEAELAVSKLPAMYIPLGELMNRLDDLEGHDTIVTMCRSGVRSKTAQAIILQHYPQATVLNALGGMKAWRDEVDPSIEVG